MIANEMNDWRSCFSNVESQLPLGWWQVTVYNIYCSLPVEWEIWGLLLMQINYLFLVQHFCLKSLIFFYSKLPWKLMEFVCMPAAGHWILYIIFPWNYLLGKKHTVNRWCNKGRLVKQHIWITVTRHYNNYGNAVNTSMTQLQWVEMHTKVYTVGCRL